MFVLVIGGPGEELLYTPWRDSQAFLAGPHTPLKTTLKGLGAVEGYMKRG